MAPDAPYARLTEIIQAIAFATGGQPVEGSVDLAALSRRTGIEEQTILTMLRGGRAMETSVADRARNRLAFLRAHYLREDGKKHSQEELAAIAGVTRQTLADWHKKGVPGLEATEKLRAHFDLMPGFFTTDEATALALALEPVLRDLERKTDPLGPLRTTTLYKLAMRAPDMPAGALNGLLDWAELVTRPRDDRGAAPDNGPPRESQ